MNVKLVVANAEEAAEPALVDSRRRVRHEAHQDEGGHHHHDHHHHHQLTRVLDSDRHPVNVDALQKLVDEVRDADLAAPAVVLPDFYHKHNMEMPSSIAVATRDTVRPTLTSAAVNCGMALIALDGERPRQLAIEAFYRGIKARYPYPTTMRRDLTRGEVVECAVQGAGFAVDRWNIDPEEISRIEEFGCLDLQPYGGAELARRELPWMLAQLARMRFGTVGPSTHFVELQEVEEVLDPAVARRLGLEQGQITLQYHAGGGVLTGLVGAMFGKRKGGNGILKKLIAAQKPFLHLASARSLDELRLRWALYFGSGCPPIPWESDEGRRVLLANMLAMNYGFAFRQATYAALRQLARETLASGSHLVVDSPHNSIYEEEVGGRKALVHRHNTSRARPKSMMAGHPAFADTGQPILVPGTNRTCSYVCVAGEGAHESLHSSCHGTGSIIDDFVNRGMSGYDPEGHTTLKFRYSTDEPEVVQHFDNVAVDEGIRIMADHDIVRPVARLRPFAVLN
jgi:RNA-splicing ligase RtcB